MITKRLMILLGVITLGMGVVFVLPEFKGAQPMGVAFEPPDQIVLPDRIGDWTGIKGEISDKEKQVLGADTLFARKMYRNRDGSEIYVTIVLAGEDVTTSLHQPERCLPAQGFNIVDKRLEKVPLDGAPSSLTATRLHNERNVPLSNGDVARAFSLDYYWFVGCSDLCATPFSRDVIDWRDRVFKGYSQRWAYVTVFAGVRGDGPEAAAEGDAVIKKFIAQLFPKIWKPGSVFQG